MTLFGRGSFCAGFVRTLRVAPPRAVNGRNLPGVLGTEAITEERGHGPDTPRDAGELPDRVLPGHARRVGAGRRARPADLRLLPVHPRVARRQDRQADDASRADGPARRGLGGRPTGRGPGPAGRRLPRDTRASMRLEAGFEETRGALASADAHRHHPVLRLAAKHLVGNGADHARAGHAEGVADRDRPAVGIELLHGDAEPVAAVDHLRGEGLVELPHADVLELDAGPLEQLWDRVHGTDAHLVGLAPGHGEAAEDQLGLDAERLGAVHGHEHRGGGAVGELGGVARRHRALSAVLVEVGRQLEETLERGVSAVALVLVDVVILFARDLARLLVDDAAHHLERRQLFLEEAFLLRARRALLTRQRVLVLGLAANLVALGHDLGRVAHDHVQRGLVLLDPRVGIAVALHHADALEPAADGGLGSAHDDLVGGHGDGLEPRRAEAVDGGAGHADGKAGAEERDARHVVALGAVGLGAAHDHVLDLTLVELGNLTQRVLDAMGGEVVRAGHVERPPERLGERGAGAGDDDSLSHRGSFLGSAGWREYTPFTMLRPPPAGWARRR